ncbi:MAG: hypothetical protein HQM10_18075 [Candidatus Riflebacteria bacterium]|nr:hypothetical protein [Candidatus Riflebacteria bacterium]
MKRKGFSAMEIMIAVVLAIGCMLILYKLFSHYSRFFIKLDNRIENISEAWLTAKALSEDLLMADVADGDISKWKDSIKVLVNGCSIKKRINGRITDVNYIASGSLIRTIEGAQTVLIKKSCKSFLFEPCFNDFVGSFPKRISVHVKFEITPDSSKGLPPSSPLTIETTFVPEFLNLRLRRKYFHQGLPE